MSWGLGHVGVSQGPSLVGCDRWKRHQQGKKGTTGSGLENGTFCNCWVFAYVCISEDGQNTVLFVYLFNEFEIVFNLTRFLLKSGRI